MQSRGWHCSKSLILDSSHREMRLKSLKRAILGPIGHQLALLKGEIHSKINSIWKERVHFFLQNSEKIMKIGWEIRKIWHFEISNFFGKHFLTSPYEYSNERVDDVIPSQFFIYIVYKILNFFIFSSYRPVKTYPHIKMYQSKHYCSLTLGGYKASFIFT